MFSKHTKNIKQTQDEMGIYTNFIIFYREMRAANVINSDKYYHSKANYLAARHGGGGLAAARHLR